MPYIIEVDKKTGKMENKGIGCEHLPDEIEVMDSLAEFTFKLPIGYKTHQIYWNKRELKFDEYFLLLKKEQSNIFNPKIEVYTGGRGRLKKREIREFNERKDTAVRGFKPNSIIEKLVYVGDEKSEFRIETEQIGRYWSEYPDKVTLFYGKKEIPLDELLVKGSSSL